MEKKYPVSLCMIVKNEEAVLGRCLSSLEGIVDEIIVVDTGSTDETVRVAEEYGAIVKHFEWNDNFAAARNYSLSFATKYWVLVLDADEYLRDEDRELLIETLNDPQYDTYFIKTLNFSHPGDKSSCMVNLNHRIFKNNKGFYYSGAIHEQLRFPESAPYKVTDIGFYHTGYLGKTVTGKDKPKRNIEILTKLLEEDPDNPFHQFNIANDFFQLGDYEKAIEFYNKAYAHSKPSQGHMPKLVVFRINAYIANKQLEEALKFAEAGLKQYPKFTHLMYLKGTIEEDLGLNIRAVNSYQACIKMGPPGAEFEFMPGSSGPWPHLKLAKLYEDQGAYELAINHYNQYLALEPSQHSILYGVVSCLKKMRLSPDVIVACLEKYLPHESLQTMIVKADLLIRHGFFEKAQDYLDGLISEEAPAMVVHMYARNQFYLKNYKESLSYFLKHSVQNGFKYSAVYCYLIFLLTEEKELDPEVREYPESICLLDQCFKNQGTVTFDDKVITTAVQLLDECLMSQQTEMFNKLSHHLEIIENSALWQELVKLYLKYKLTTNAQALLLKLIIKEKCLNKGIIDLIKEL